MLTTKYAKRIIRNIENTAKPKVPATHANAALRAPRAGRAIKVAVGIKPKRRKKNANL